jgi:methyl-accepting chemotaxis protein
MLKNQKIRYRILAGYSVPVILFIIAAIVVYMNIKSYEYVHANTERAGEIFIETEDLSFHVASLQRSARGYLLHKNEATRNNYEKAQKGAEVAAQSLNTLVKDDKQKEELRKIEGLSTKVDEITKRLMTLVDEGKTDEAVKIFRESLSLKLTGELENTIDEFEKNNKVILETFRKEEETALEKVGIILLIGTLLSIVLSFIASLWIANNITKPITMALNALSSTSIEIATTVTQHERAAAQQASMINETTTTMQELGASSRQTADQATATTEIAQDSLKATEEGSVIVKQAIDGMNNLGGKVGMIADQILKLGEQTAQIGNLANMVKDLAGEINMLALNAAVEAARAGEHGKGFAVVAGEVRKLANESKKSAEQSNTIISEIQKATNATILKTEEGTKVVEEVSGFARNVGELFNSLSNSANKVYENAQQVLLNAKQQTTAVSQVGEAMNELNTGARETAAGITQTKVGLEQLNSAAQNLKQIV